MARLARVIAKNLPHHITQRGNRRQNTFFCEEDYRLYIRLMAQWCNKLKVEIWAYCLMPTTESVFSQKTAAVIGEFLRVADNEFIFERFMSPEMGRTSFAKTLNRSVSGSMNDFVNMARIDLEHFSFSLFEISERLNTCPMSYIGYNRPRDVFMAVMNTGRLA